jgi:hypothetical protein
VLPSLLGFDAASDDTGQVLRVVHHPPAVQNVRLPKRLAGQGGGHGDHRGAGRECCRDPRRGVLDRQTFSRPYPKLARREEVHLGVGFAVLDVVAGYDHVELLPKPQDVQNAQGLLAVGLGG